MALVQTSHSSDPIVKYAMIQCNCCTRLVPGKIIMWSDNPEKVPLHMPCKKCGKALSHAEEDNNDILEKMCMGCFQEEVEEWEKILFLKSQL